MGEVRVVILRLHCNGLLRGLKCWVSLSAPLVWRSQKLELRITAVKIVRIAEVVFSWAGCSE